MFSHKTSRSPWNYLRTLVHILAISRTIHSMGASGASRASNVLDCAGDIDWDVQKA